MNVFVRAYEWLFWTHEYRGWLLTHRLGDYMYLDSLPSRARREAERIIAYYHVRGRAQALRPRDAVYKTLVESAVAFKDMGRSEDQEDDWASTLYCFAPARVPSRWAHAAERGVGRI